MKPLLKYGTFPLMLIGVNGLLIWLVASDLAWGYPFAVLCLAIAFMMWAEQVIPYNPDWNRSHADSARDWIHFVVNTAANHASIFLLPVFASFAVFKGQWPDQWPFWLQVLGAILVLDFGIAAAHHASHKWHFLWRFHAVHHSVKRMYGLNGLMKHPVHQAIETASGIFPLLLLGIPSSVATAVAFCVAIQLLLQHSNADYRTGWLKYLFANAEVHRFHHRMGSGVGDVNFGLFTTGWDHLVGSFFYRADEAPRHSDEIGIFSEDDYPNAYMPQLLKPFRDLMT